MLYIGHLLPTNFRIKQFGACKIEGAYLARSFGRFEPIDIGYIPNSLGFRCLPVTE